MSSGFTSEDMEAYDAAKKEGSLEMAGSFGRGFVAGVPVGASGGALGMLASGLIFGTAAALGKGVAGGTGAQMGIDAAMASRADRLAGESATAAADAAATQERKLLTAVQKADAKASKDKSKTVSSDRVLAANTTTPAGPQTTGFGQESVYTPRVV